MGLQPSSLMDAGGRDFVLSAREEGLEERGMIVRERRKKDIQYMLTGQQRWKVGASLADKGHVVRVLVGSKGGGKGGGKQRAYIVRDWTVGQFRERSWLVTRES